VNESPGAQASSSCKAQVVTAITGIALFAGLIILAVLSLVTSPRSAPRSGAEPPLPLGTGKPEDGVWSGHRHWPEPENLPREVDRQGTQLGQQYCGDIIAWLEAWALGSGLISPWRL
jgi:hypothetical protein